MPTLPTILVSGACLVVVSSPHVSAPSLKYINKPVFVPNTIGLAF